MALADAAFVALQQVLPLHLVSRAVHALAGVESPLVRRALIRGFLALYEVDLAEAQPSDPDAYPSFNAFFTRALRPGARPVDADPAALVSPCDGVISQIGELQGEELLQATVAAKRRVYTLRALLADAGRAAPFVGGAYACIYLAPRDYHRVHLPVAGRLTGATHVPGALYSVNAATAQRIDALYARNERIVLTFETRHGPLAVVLVGALNVGSMGLAWCPVVAGGGAPRALPAPPLEFPAGAEIGRFNLGSTVIVIAPPRTVAWLPGLAPGSVLRMGSRLGTRP